ncbi:hypothetical protein YC2023_100046 [Brassica napus]
MRHNTMRQSHRMRPHPIQNKQKNNLTMSFQVVLEAFVHNHDSLPDFRRLTQSHQRRRHSSRIKQK